MAETLSYPLEIINKHVYLRDWMVFHAFRGSIAHGMHNPDPESIDDIDTIAVVVPPIDYYFGLKVFGSRGTQEIKDGRYDTVVYDVQKIMGLLKNGNPNVLSMLWTGAQYFLYWKSSIGKLFEQRKLFSTKLAYNAFAGYANGQLMKMQSGQVYEGYMGEKRRKLVDQFGYDTKNAAHCIRLLRMAVEFFQNDGELMVDRRGIDDEVLLEIKNGEWDIDQVHHEATRLFDLAHDAKEKCSLPEFPDDEAINKLCVEIIMDEFVERDDLY